MNNTKKSLRLGAAFALCLTLLLGCSEEPKQKTETKANVQQQLGKEAAKAVKEPVIEARKAAEAQGKADQAIKEAAQDVKPGATGQEKKKLEGC